MTDFVSRSPRQETRTVRSSYAGVVSFILGAVLIAGAMPSWAQHSRHEQETFTDPDGAFTFRYSSQLIVCQKQKQGSDEGFYWVPAERCNAYHPVCDGLTPEHYKAVACLAYPKDEHSDTDAFEAATFSVEILDGVADAKKCSAPPSDAGLEPRSALKIHGVSFTAFEFGDAGMNQAVGAHVYRTFHEGKCYQLGINIATANAGVFDPPARELSQQDMDAIQGVLEAVRDSFRFVK